MQTTSFAVPDISCDGCATAIRTALRRLCKVYDIAVDVPYKIVTVSHDGPADVIATALGQAGFPATVTRPPDV